MKEIKDYEIIFFMLEMLIFIGVVALIIYSGYRLIDLFV